MRINPDKNWNKTDDFPIWVANRFICVNGEIFREKHLKKAWSFCRLEMKSEPIIEYVGIRQLKAKKKNVLNAIEWADNFGQ